MNIMYLCNDAYVHIAAVSIISLLQNNKLADFIHIFIVGDEISDINKKKLIDTVEGYNRKITILEKPDLKTLINCKVEMHWWIENVFSRVFLSEVFKEYKNIERLLYIDCDTLIVGNLIELWNIDLENKVAAGVLEAMGNLHKRAIGLSNEEPYFNAGVFIIDMNKWRKHNFDKEASTFIKKLNGKMEYADESVLNGILAPKMKILPLKYNITSLSIYLKNKEVIKYRKPSFHYNEKEHQEALADARIIHFTSTYMDVRPWVKGSKHPYAIEWIDIKNESLWKDVPLQLDSRSIIKKISRQMVFFLPRRIRLSLTGFIHAYIKPLKYIKRKSRYEI